MALALVRRYSTRTGLASPGICSKTSDVFRGKDREPTKIGQVRNTQAPSSSSASVLSQLVNDRKPQFDGCKVNLVDDDAWQVSSVLSQAWRGFDMKKHSETLDETGSDHMDSSVAESDLELDEIDDMRIQGNLFYKIDRGSKEFEEYNHDLYRKKSSKSKEDKQERQNQKETAKNRDEPQEIRKKESLGEKLSAKIQKDYNVNRVSDESGILQIAEKRERTLTFNQITAPYHYPFCLDIYISKASVRACIVHRVSSKVVAVAHSISKDLKFDLSSTRNATACSVVGGILAERALADDIHDVIYTPRKGDKLEGKLQIVLQAVIDNGVNVKVKLKQRKIWKTGQPQRFNP